MAINIGTIGAGGFSRFSIEAFLETGLAEVSGVYDIDRDRSGNFSDRFGGKVYDSMEDLINSPEVDLVYISTPPFLHYEQTLRALMAEKHVICEKPAALKAAEAKELVETARQKQLLYAVNLMQRYNPLFRQVKEVIDNQLLGEFLHGYLENYAADEGLEPDHWMWKQTWSGGIFIEHAVHFFDLFSGWLGDGKVISSQKLQRPGQDKPLWSRVQAIVKYPGGLVNFYHGFDQAVQMDRQEFRLLFERGEITLFEWVPTRIIIHGLVLDEHLTALQTIFGDAEIDICEVFDNGNNHFRGRFKDFQADKEIIMTSGDDVFKMERYKAMLSDMFRDQANWINDHDHERVITGMNGYTSLLMAEQADQKAVKL